MKTLKLITALLLSVFMLGACTAEEELNIQTTRHGNVHFRLEGAASQSKRTRTIAEGNESRVDNVLALLWDTEEASKYYVVEAVPTGEPGEYDINVENDGRYCVIFVANADKQTREKLENLERVSPGFHSYVDYTNLIRNLISDQKPDGDTFLMMSPSTTMYYFTISVSSGQFDLGTIVLERRSARFDIINKADNITIDKITYNNRTILTTLHPERNNGWTTDDSWYENKVYTNLNLEGNSNEEKAGRLLHTIYSYRNYSTAENGKLPSLTIEYTEKKDDGTETKRSHEVKFIDPNAPSNTPLAIKANSLYTITLTKAQKLEFNLSVSDWNEGESFSSEKLTVNDLRNITSEEQNSLNEALWVNRFAPYYVKSIDPDSHAVEFFTEFSTDLNNYSTANNGVYYTWQEINNYKLTGESDNTLTDKLTGKTYKVPSVGEACLLFPYNPLSFEPEYVYEKIVGTESNRSPFVSILQSGINDYNQETSNSASLTRWTERISFKNNSDFTPYVPKQEDADLYSEIHIIRGSNNTLTTNYNKDDDNVIPDEKGDYVASLFPAYAVRFKGTGQYSAYKWETLIDKTSNRLYGSIKIKAIPEKLDVSVYDITNNDEYWSHDYIEYRIPFIGRIAASGNRVNHWIIGFLTTSKYFENNKNPLIPCFQHNSVSIFSKNYAYRYPLMLIETQK